MCGSPSLPEVAWAIGRGALVDGSARVCASFLHDGGHSRYRYLHIMLTLSTLPIETTLLVSSQRIVCAKGLHKAMKAREEKEDVKKGYDGFEPVSFEDVQ